MKHLKKLFVLFFIFTLSCSTETENNVETTNSNKVSKVVNPKPDFNAMVSKTSSKLKALLKSEGYDDLYDSDIVLGKSVDNNFMLTSNKKVREMLMLKFKLITQKIDYNVDYDTFNVLPAKENNGYAMMISKGVCNVTGEIVSLGLNIKINNDGTVALRDDGGGSVVTCVGCTSGCSPRRDENGDGYCTSCAPGTSHKCQKTESI